MLPTTHIKLAKVDGKLICQSVEFTNTAREKYRSLLDKALREAKDEGIEVSSKTLANANDFINNQSLLELFDFPTISVECDISILFEWRDKSQDGIETILSVRFQQEHTITAFSQFGGESGKYDSNIRFALSNFRRKGYNDG